MHVNNVDDTQAKRVKIKSYEYIKRQFKSKKKSLALNEQQENVKQAVEQTQKELVALQNKKESLLQDIRMSINNEKDNWQTEKQKLIKQAQLEGHEAGFLGGEQQSIEHYAQSMKQANAIVESATKDYHETVDQSESEIIELATQIAGKIIKQEIEQDENIMLQVVKATIRDIKEQPMIAIYIHPNHYQTLLQRKKELEKAVDGDCKISMFVDQDLSKFDCRIEHPFGQIDAGIDTQLDQIQGVLQALAMEQES